MRYKYGFTKVTAGESVARDTDRNGFSSVAGITVAALHQ